MNLSLPKPLHEKVWSLRPQTLLKAPQGLKTAPSAPAVWTYPPQNSDISPVISSEEPELLSNIANNSSNTEPPVVDMKCSLLREPEENDLEDRLRIPISRDD